MGYQSLQQLSAAPASPYTGLIYFDTSYNAIGVYDGSEWVYGSKGGWGTTGTGGGSDVGGDLSGTLPDPTVVKIQGYPVADTEPTEDYVLTWNGSEWAPAESEGGGGGISSVSAGDDSVSVTTTDDEVTIETGTLDEIANLHSPAANWSNAGYKITDIADGSASSDAAAYGQLPSSSELVPAGSTVGYVLSPNSSGDPEWTPQPSQALQPGLLGNVNTGIITATIDSSTGALTFTNWPDDDAFFWAEDNPPTIGFIPSSGNGTPTLPSSGDYLYVAAIVNAPDVQGGTGTAAFQVGTAESTVNLAASYQVAQGDGYGYVVLWDGLIYNDSGVYSLVLGGLGAYYIPSSSGRDRRLWARGAFGLITRTSNASDEDDYTTTSTSMTPIDATNLALRVECSGSPLLLTLFGNWQQNTTGQALHADFFSDGDSVVGSGATPIYQGATTSGEAFTLYVQYVWAPEAGSHLIVPNWSVSEDEGTMLCRSGFPVQFSVREVIGSTSQSNGTE